MLVCQVFRNVICFVFLKMSHFLQTRTIRRNERSEWSRIVRPSLSAFSLITAPRMIFCRLPCLLMCQLLTAQHHRRSAALLSFCYLTIVEIHSFVAHMHTTVKSQLYFYMLLCVNSDRLLLQYLEILVIVPYSVIVLDCGCCPLTKDLLQLMFP